MRRGWAFVTRRLGVAAVVIFVAATLNFGLFRLAPGNPAEAMSRVPGAGPALQHELRREFGLDQSVWEQYVLYFRNMVTGNLGVSFQNREPVVTNLWDELRNTVPMVLAGTVIAIAIGTLVGIGTGVARGSLRDHAGVGLSTMMYSLPPQWVGIILIILCGSFLPTSGLENPFLLSPSFPAHLLDLTEHAALPALTFALTLFGQFALITRSSVLDTLGDDYILTARAKGLARWEIVRRHVLRNAMLPTVTLSALSIGYVVGGAVLVETVFSYPGIGLGIYQAVGARDYPLLEGQFLVLVVAVVICNLLADLLIYRLDPRIRVA